MLFTPRRRTTWPKKDAVPPGASLAYNLPQAHAPAAAWPHAAIVPHVNAAIVPHVNPAIVPPMHAVAAPNVYAATVPQVDQASAPHVDAAIVPHVAPVAPVIAHAVAPGTSADAPWDHAALSAADPAAPSAALRRAILICGGQSALASAIGLTQSHVWNWLSRASIPAEHCPAIERATQRAVRCEDLRPDVDWAYLRAVCEELAEVREGAA